MTAGAALLCYLAPAVLPDHVLRETFRNPADGRPRGLPFAESVGIAGMFLLGGGLSLLLEAAGRFGCVQEARDARRSVQPLAGR